jgi:aminomethyltransferase
MMVVNASNQVKIDGWVKENFGPDVFTNKSYDIALVALQGPKAQAILDKAFEADHSGIPSFGVKSFTWKGIPVILARTGYTGEDGFEIFIDNPNAVAVWSRLFGVGGEKLLPVGLGARDTLRLEVCYSLYGNELEEDINPYEAGVGWVVKMKKGDFIGRDKLAEIKEKGITRKIHGMIVEGGPVPRHGYKLFDGAKEAGYVTSGCLSPVLDEKIALGYLPAAGEYEPGGKVEIEMHNKRFGARIVETPFYKRSE